MFEFYNLLTSSQLLACTNFTKEHRDCYAGAIGGGISYIISPTGLGELYSVKCNICDTELTLNASSLD
jgi:hypothetical protein